MPWFRDERNARHPRRMLRSGPVAGRDRVERWNRKAITVERHVMLGAVQERASDAVGILGAGGSDFKGHDEIRCPIKRSVTMAAWDA